MSKKRLSKEQVVAAAKEAFTRLHGGDFPPSEPHVVSKPDPRDWLALYRENQAKDVEIEHLQSIVIRAYPILRGVRGERYDVTIGALNHLINEAGVVFATVSNRVYNATKKERNTEEDEAPLEAGG